MKRFITFKSKKIIHLNDSDKLTINRAMAILDTNHHLPWDDGYDDYLHYSISNSHKYHYEFPDHIISSISVESEV